MLILITSGGTTENIDQVRGITNFATGNLGKLIAERFLMANHNVILLAGRGAILPDPHPKLTILPISDVADLLVATAKWTPEADVFIHSMAVSDYTPIYMTDFETVAASSNLEATRPYLLVLLPSRPCHWKPNSAALEASILTIIDST